MEVYKYTGKDDIRYMPTKRFKSIIEQYPLENNKNHAKKSFKPWQASAISTSYDFLGTKSIHILWIENIINEWLGFYF